MSDQKGFVAGNVVRFDSVADQYDKFRPQPPPVIVNLLVQLAEAASLNLVVDLASGTSLSTVIWRDHARRVIGIEPNVEMRRRSETNFLSPNSHNIEFRSGNGHETGLPHGTADIVTCSQALHWMEPETTFAEVARILRPGGVFAAYDCDWPPAVIGMLRQRLMPFSRNASGWQG